MPRVSLGLGGVRKGEWESLKVNDEFMTASIWNLNGFLNLVENKNEGPTHTVRHQMYEPLIIRDTSGAFEPALATDWAPSESDPNVWVFNLRQGVKFHDGADFTAEAE